MKTTLNAIRAQGPCCNGWKKLLQHLGKTEDDDALLSIATVLDSNGLDDAVWCLRAVTGHDREIRLFAVWCARRVQHLNTDPSIEKVLVIAEAFANGTVSDWHLLVAKEESWDKEMDSAKHAASVSANSDAWSAAWSTAQKSRWAVTSRGNYESKALAEAEEIVAQATELRRVCAEIDAGGAK